MHGFATMNLGNTLLTTHIITGKYVVSYITSLFQKTILLLNVLLSVNLVVNAMLLHYVTCYISNALLLTVN